MFKIQEVRESIDVDEFNSLINQFKCTLDPDIESFIKNKAVEFQYIDGQEYPVQLICFVP